MTFPTIPTAGASTLLTTNQATATTTHTFPSLTTLDNAAGDLLLAIIVTYQGGSANAEFSAWGGGFTEFVDQSANSTTVQSIGAAYKFSDGTETGTFTVTSVASNRSVMFLLSIKAAHASTVPEGGAKANGTAAAADPVSLDPAGWNTEDTLWIDVAVNGETSLTGSFTGITAAPANYGSYVDSGIIGGDVIGALEGAVAFRQLNAAAEDVTGFTLDTGAAGNSALLIAVRPAALQPVGDPYQRDPRWYRANIFFRPSAKPIQWSGDRQQASETPTEAQIGTDGEAFAGTATEVKVAKVTGTCSIGAAGAAIGRKVAIPTGPAAAVAAGTAIEKKVAPQVGTATAAAIGTGLESQGAPPVVADPNQALPQVAVMFLDPWGAAFQLQGDSAGVTTQVEAQTGASIAAPIASATERKVAVQRGTVSTAPAGMSADAKKAAQTGTGSLGMASTHTGGAVRAQTGVCGIGAVGSGTGRKIGVSRGISAIGSAGTGTTAKRAAAIGRCSAALVGTRSGVISRAQIGMCGIGGASTATGRKVASGHQGHVAVAPTARGTNAKRATGHVSTSGLAPAGMGLQARRAGQRGTTTIAAVQTWTAAVPDPNPLRITFTERATAAAYTERAIHTFTDPDTGIIYQEGED